MCAHNRYKGFSVNSLSVLSSQIYITAYEMTRAFTRPMFESEMMCNLTAGVMASVVQQGVAVPIDVVSQRLMVDRRGGGAATARLVAKAIIRDEGARGFWKGTAASLLTFAPTSGIFWAAYGWLRRVQIARHPAGGPGPSYWPTLGEQAMASGLAGCVAAACTNPLDIIKTRVQISCRSDGPDVNMSTAFRALVREEGAGLVVKGLSARMLHMSVNSVILMTVS
jgi:solute carrier family 25 protein 44